MVDIEVTPNNDHRSTRKGVEEKSQRVIRYQRGQNQISPIIICKSNY